MIPYNTDKKPIILAEYGRNVEGLVKHCVAIEDREERNRCAYALADLIANLFPELEGENGDRKQIWDTMNIISEFKLDVDFPCDVMTEDKMSPKPERIPYTASSMRYRHYGKNIEKMINTVADMPDGEERELLVSLMAHHMKKLMLMHNKEGVDDAKILRDLAQYSGGKIDLDPETYLLHEFKDASSNTGSNNSGKGKKKKKQ